MDGTTSNKSPTEWSENALTQRRSTPRNMLLATWPGQRRPGNRVLETRSWKPDPGIQVLETNEHRWQDLGLKPLKWHQLQYFATLGTATSRVSAHNQLVFLFSSSTFEPCQTSFLARTVELAHRDQLFQVLLTNFLSSGRSLAR